MKKITLILAAITILTSVSIAQYTGIPDTDIPQNQKQSTSTSNILGFINLKNFTWTNTFNMSYSSFGNMSYSVASYTGTLGYKLRDNMHISADITMQYSPYANFGTNNRVDNKSFQNYLSGVNVSRVSFNWQPFKNMFVNVEYYNPKYSNMNGFDNMFYSHYLGY